MELAPRIELGSHPYQGRVLPLYYASLIRLNLPTYLDDSDILFRGLVKPGKAPQVGAGAENRTRFSALQGRNNTIILSQLSSCRNITLYYHVSTPNNL
jgi:hypothetical protein